MSLGDDVGSGDRPDAALGDVNPSRGVPVQSTECDEIDLFLDSVTPSDPNSTSSRTTPDSIIIQNNQYIDLTEMEDDLANNNGPNNNAGDEMEDANLPTFEEEANIPTFENANVLIVDDSDKDEEEDSIASDDVGMIAMEEIVQELNNEVEKVKKLLVGASVIPPDVEIYAYLEAHLKEVNRVQIVVEELSGTNDTSPVHSREASPVRDIDHNEPKGKSGKGTYRKGGKAVAKGEKEKVLGTRAISPETTAEEENSNSRPEKRPHGEENDEKVVKKIKSDENQESKSSGERRVKKSSSQPRKQPMKWNPAEDANLLHGPFDFKAHRSDNNSSSKSSSNIADHLIQSIHSVEKLHPGTPQRTKPILKPSVLTTPPRLQQFKLKPATPLGVGAQPSQGLLTPPTKKFLVKPATPGHLNRSIPPELTPIRKERAPSIEVIDEAPNVPEIVEIIDNPVPDVPNVEVESFVKSFLEMVPDIDQDYLRARAKDLVGHVAAIERFTLEILSDPTPPANWREIYAAPFGEVRPDIVAVQQVPELVDITRDVELVETDSVQPIKAGARFYQGPSTTAWQCLDKSCRRLNGNLNTRCARCGGERQPKVLVEKEIPPVPPLIEHLPVASTSSSSAALPSSLSSAALSSSLSSAALSSSLSSAALSSSLSSAALSSSSSSATPIADPSVPPHVANGLPIPGPSSDEPVPSTSSANDATVVKTLVPLEEIDPEMRWEQEKEAYLMDIFPDFSPEWLLEQIRFFRIASGTDDARFNVRVSEIMEMDKSKIPSRKEWEKKIKEQEELDKWSGSMTVKDMLELYEDDPAGHFHNPNRVIPNKQLYSQHSRVGLMDAFRFTSTHVIDKMHKHSKFNYAMAYKAINKLAKSRKTKRPDAEIKYPADSCIEYLKEKKFVELEATIEEEKVRRENDRKAAFELARATNSLTECGCCFEECLKEDMLPCKGGHLYCKECVSRGANVAIGDGKTIIQCLGQCQEEIATRELQKALPPNVLSKLLSKRQAEEVGAADIENLVTCPYCPYSTIMENKEDKVVVCRNPECGRDSCRLCRQPNHIPLRCEELESQDEEQARKRVEEALSDAIIRNCANPKCSARFMKTEGCNKMYCEKCKTTQCYLCKSVVKGYEHFYGQGGFPTKTKVCPLWSNNDELHASEVARAAQKETAELEKEGIKLKNNPMKDIKIPDKNGAADNWRFPVDAPDLVDVIAPGAAREDVIRQQHQIEAMIRRGRGPPPGYGHAHFHPPHHPPGLPPMMPNHGDPNGFMRRMGEILRLREQTRANARLVREREHQALMEFNRGGWVGQPPMIGGMGGGGIAVAGQVGVPHVGPVRIPPVPMPMPGVQPVRALPAVQMPVEAPQAVPEPLQFADMAERHGRNIEVVDQRGMPQHRVNHRLFPGVGRDWRNFRREAEEARRRERAARLGPPREEIRGEDKERRRQRHEERRRQRHEMILANLQESRRRLQRVEAEARLGAGRERVHERVHPHVEARRARDNHQNVRERVRMLARPVLQAQQMQVPPAAREEVVDNHRARQEAREVVEEGRRQVEEVRQPEENNAQRAGQEVPAAREGERQFDFQEILNLDNLNMDYNLGDIDLDNIIEF